MVADMTEVTSRATIPIDVCLDVVGVMILFITADENVGLVNSKGQEILGYSEDEILGRNWFDSFLPANIREQTRTIFHEIMRDGTGSHEYTENRVLVAGGGERLIGWHNAVIRDEQGGILGTLSSGMDVTEYRAKEDALRESKARSQAILETTVDAIITSDELGRIQSLNPAAERMFGFTGEEAIGRSLSILMPSPYREEHDDYLRIYLATGEKKVIGIGREIVGQRKDGTTFPIELAVSEFSVAGHTFFTSVIRDISDRRELEREVLRISEDERERIGRDLHDGLGSLLSGASMGVQALVQKARKGETVQPTDLERLADMLDEGAHQAHVLARGLNPVRLEKEGLVPALSELCRNVCEMSGIPCTVATDAKLPFVAKNVAMQLYRIAQEAVTNAIKHAHASSIALELGEADGYLHLTVKDDGIGLPGEEKRNGQGMYIMPYRARLIDAHFNINAAAEGGTIVTCLVPLERLISLDQ